MMGIFEAIVTNAIMNQTAKGKNVFLENVSKSVLYI